MSTTPSPQTPVVVVEPLVSPTVPVVGSVVLELSVVLEVEAAPELELAASVEASLAEPPG
jgi:hypothetical protein